MGEKLGIGIVGLVEGMTLLRALTQTAPGPIETSRLLAEGEEGRSRYCRAVAAFDLDASRRERARQVAPDLGVCESLEELLARPDVDVVAIYTPDSTHCDLTVAAMRAGKHVICTKPLVNELSQISRLKVVAAETGRRVMVGQSTRFFQPFAEQRKRAEAGEYGEVEFVDAQYCHRMDWFYEKSPWAIDSTDWIFLGMSHPLDLLSWYLGPIRRVSAVASRSGLGRRFGISGPDIYSVQVEAADGRIGRAFGHYGLVELPSARNAIELMLYGSAGTSLAQYHDMKLKSVREDGKEVSEDWLYSQRGYFFNNEVHGMHYGEFARYADAFGEALLTGKKASPELDEGIEVVLLMEASRRSARSSEPVMVDDLRAEIR